MDAIVLFLLGVIIIGLGLIVSIAVHEVGHLVPAKVFGVYVPQYMIGFGRTLFSRRIGETEYGLKAIPFGGYVSMIGMYPPNHDGAGRAANAGYFQRLAREARTAQQDLIPEGQESRTFILLPVWQRIIIMFSGPFMNLVIGAVCYAILVSGIGIAQPSLTIETVSKCIVPVTVNRQTCTSTDPAAPAAQAGIRPGDTIETINGKRVTSWDSVTHILEASAGQHLAIGVTRDGAQRTVDVVPRATQRYVYDKVGQPKRDGAGKPIVKTVGFLGIGPTSELARQPITTVPAMVGENVSAVVGLVVQLPQKVVGVLRSTLDGTARDPNSPLSIVGVGRVAGQVAANTQITVVDKVSTLVSLLASLNIALFVFNLVPLTPLDGGHLAGALWEGLKRITAKLLRRQAPEPFDAAKLIPVTAVVFGLLIFMSAILIIADLVNPIKLFG